VDLAAGEKFIVEWSQQGATIVGLASENTLLGLFAVRDVVKPNAKQIVEQLQQQGLKTYLLTGDNSLTAASIAKQVGIAAENVFAEVRPEQKAEFVKKLQTAGERVAFVGDGINDAPALTQADLGIAVSRASDVAREAADIILLNSEIQAVPEALGLARATLRTIKQNLFWAFFYNAAGIPLAALGFMSPVLCALAMVLSDLVVIGNALRLLRWEARPATRQIKQALRLGRHCIGEIGIQPVRAVEPAGTGVRLGAASLLAGARLGKTVEFLFLIRCQFLSDFGMDSLHFLVHHRGDGFPNNLGSLLAGGDDFLDVRVLFGGQFQFAIHAAQQINISHLPGIGGHGIRATAPSGTVGRSWADLRDPQGAADDQAAGQNAGNKNNQRGQNDLPGIHWFS